MKVLRLKDVIERTGLGRSSIYSSVAAGDFPAPIPIGVRSRGWIESEIDQWIEERAAQRDRAAG